MLIIGTIIWLRFTCYLYFAFYLFAENLWNELHCLNHMLQIQNTNSKCFLSTRNIPKMSIKYIWKTRFLRIVYYSMIRLFWDQSISLNLCCHWFYHYCCCYYYCYYNYLSWYSRDLISIGFCVINIDPYEKIQQYRILKLCHFLKKIYRYLSTDCKLFFHAVR